MSTNKLVHFALSFLYFGLISVVFGVIICSLSPLLFFCHIHHFVCHAIQNFKTIMVGVIRNENPLELSVNVMNVGYNENRLSGSMLSIGLLIYIQSKTRSTVLTYSFSSGFSNHQTKSHLVGCQWRLDHRLQIL